VPDVAHSVVLHGFARAGLGDLEGAVSTDREALSLYTTLVSANSDRYRDAYANAIELLAAHLEGLGRTEQEIAEELDGLLRQG
jgi:hypothetical protein